jgi:hypothetical protein
MPSNDPHALARQLHAENLTLRELLAAVAHELERLATDEPSAERRERLLRRAMRVRERLHAG